MNRARPHLGIAVWDVALLSRNVLWEGHVSRFAAYDNNRITLCA